MGADSFRRFATMEAAVSSPLYAALAEQIAGDERLRDVFEAAGDRHVALVFAVVHRVLADHVDDPLAAYYASLGGDRAPDAELPKVFEAFVLGHRDRIQELLATRDTQSNEPLRAAQLRPAFGWAQAGLGRSLGLIEVGTSAGLLLYPDRYGYEYAFGDGSVLEQPPAAGSDPRDTVQAPVLRCPVRGSATAKTLAPLVTKDLRISSRVGLDLNPLNPADAETRAWLRAQVWPEEADRRSRLDAALVLAARYPARLRKGDALDILPTAVGMVSAPAVPCVFVSNALAHFSDDARAGFVELIRGLGSRQDLVLILKEPDSVGLGLFTRRPAADPSAPRVESLGAVLYQAGRERCFVLGTAGPHGAWLDWAPAVL
ncbi:DUF2332 domain-containing protein [Catenulispora subtropica]|uniref:DUF2332 domain-containing protein n=1 Tax=Catenulispora subtropica TaxID=450798 RepID=A0ABN2QC67_9ACTN